MQKQLPFWSFLNYMSGNLYWELTRHLNCSAHHDDNGTTELPRTIDHLFILGVHQCYIAATP